MTLPRVESQIQAIQERQLDLLKQASAPGVGEQLDEVLGRLHTEKARLMELREELLKEQEKKTAIDHRLDEIDAVLDRASEGIGEYDDVLVRQLIGHIKVRDKQTLVICFKDGTVVEQSIEMKNR